MLALDALGNPVRRDILALLRERPHRVNELAGHFPISRPAVSRHLKLLVDSGLVSCEVQGRTSLYSVRDEGFAALDDYLSQFWDEALFRFQMVTENLEER